MTPTARRMIAAIAGAGAALVLACVPVRADDFVDQVNAPFARIAKEKRSDLVLLPLLAKLAPPPAVLKSQQHAAMLGSAGPGWEECAKWATGESQRALLDALPKVTVERDHRKAFVFAQPYGVGGVDLDLVSIDMYTELGETPTLAAANFKYLPAMENFGILVQVEASRRAKEGDANGAMDLLIDWALFGRQFADRPFLKEKSWGLTSMNTALERLRDIAFQDYRAREHKLEPERIRDAIEKVPPKGYLSMDRLSLPEGEMLARRQLLNRVLKKGGGVDEGVFGPTMARIAAQDRPLRLFSDSAYWDNVGAAHANHLDTDRALTGIWNDWTKRWDLSPFDPVHQNKSDFTLKVMGRPRFAVLNQSLDGIEKLFEQRRHAQVELSGTRMALAVYAYFLKNKSLPPALNSTRPSIVAGLDPDPYSQKPRDFGYIVAGRDNPKAADGTVQPYRVRLFPPDPYPSFEVPIQPGAFVLYSVGPNGIPEACTNATQSRLGVSGDYILWPPTIALYRQRLIDTNTLH